MKNDVVVTTWSHTSYSDIWEMYYGQYKKHAPFLDHCMMINEIGNGFPADCTPLVNNEEERFHKRLTDSLNMINNESIIYAQEDFVLYDNVNEEYLDSLVSFLNDSDYDFIRLIKSGFHSGGDHGKLINEDLHIWEIPKTCPYLYSLQATVWKRKSIIDLFSFYRPRNMMQAELQGSNACRAIGVKGCYIYNGGSPRGSLHWDSVGYPYVSTALHGGSHGKPAQWAMTEYPELEGMLKEYNIDPSVRGVM